MKILNFIRCNHATIVLMIVLPIVENLFGLEKKVFHVLFLIWNFFYFYEFMACKY